MPEPTQDRLARGIARLLANTYTLYLTTQNYHWNVEGPMFHSLHTMFEVQYTELAMSIDIIAERLRALGYFAPGTFAAFQELATVTQRDSIPEAPEMVAHLIQIHDTILGDLPELLELAAEIGDEASVDLFTERQGVHQKTRWMLGATLGGHSRSLT